MGEREREQIAPREFHNNPHKIMPTGPVEDVTPWDLFPPPIHPSKPTGPVEDVTPWEVMPGPPPPTSKPTSTKSPHKKRQKPDNPSLKSSSTPAYNPIPPLSPSRRSLPHSDSSHHSVPYSIAFPPNISHSRSHSQFHEGHTGTYSKPPPIPPPPLFSTGSVNGSKSLRPTPTGPMSEVTPWELHDPDEGVPDDMSYSSSLDEDKDESQSIEHEQELEIPDLYDFKNLNSVGQLLLRSRLSGSVASLTSRGAMSLEELEEVTPWELYPVPTSEPKADGMVTRPSTASGSKSALFFSSLGDTTTTTTTTTITNGNTGVGAQSSTSRALAEFGIRRRRSTGTSNKTKGSVQSNIKGVSSSTANPPGDAVHVHSPPVGPGPAGPSMQTSANGHLHPPPSPSGTTPHPVSFPPSNPRPHALSFSTANSNGSSNASSSKRQSTEIKAKPKFSTADRTILEQLTASIRAREEQFVLKGIGNTVVGGGRSPGKRHHRWKKDEVPYPRSYEREVIDLDVWETMFCLEICESLTWHVFEEPPTKVLELGCGTGTWTLHCARTWKQCHFVGLDVVPLHPDLQNVGSPDLASRITWMQHNFLEGLPFQNEEFDFVHIKRIALGVPEDQWDPLFAEILRVMKPGGAFEMVEEDLFFPGKPIDDKDDSDDDDAGFADLYHSKSSERVNEDIPTARARISMSITTPQIPVNVVLGRGRSRPGSPTRGRAATDAAASQHDLPQLNIPRGLPGVTASPSKPKGAFFTSFIPAGTYVGPQPSFQVKSTQPVSDIPFGELEAAFNPADLSFFGSGVTLLGMAVTGDSFTEAMKKRGRSTSTLTTGTSTQSVNSSRGALAEPQAQPQPSSQSNAPGGLVATGASGSKVTASPSMSTAPADPRDHSVLEAVWNGMLASRFINTSPLSMLPNYLGIHFKDVRTHPPLMYTFPPVLPRMYSSDEEDDKEEKGEAGDSEPDTDEARDAVVPRPKKLRSIKSSRKSMSTAPHSDGRGELTENHRWLSMQALLRHSSPYVSLDDSRGHAYAPSNRVSSPPRKSKDGKLLTARRTSRLPNTTLNIDLRTLNLHLALRAKEIIACSESMWEWVEEHQAESKAGGLKPLQTSRNRSGSLDANLMTTGACASSSSLDITKDTLQYMTRDDFDQLLGNFSLDMQDQAGLGNAMQERFNWHTFPSPILQDRKVFNIACKKYDKWAEEEKAKSASHPYYAQPSPGLVPSLPDTHDSGMMARSISTPQPNANVGRPSSDDTHSIATTVTVHQRSEPADGPHPPSTSYPPIQSVPTQRLSRAVRVFVGWKAA